MEIMNGILRFSPLYLRLKFYSNHTKYHTKFLCFEVTFLEIQIIKKLCKISGKKKYLKKRSKYNLQSNNSKQKTIES